MIKTQDSFDTIEDYNAHMLDMDVETIQLHPGRFQSSQTRAWLKEMYFGVLTGSLQVSHATQFPENVYYLKVVSGPTPTISEGVDLKADDAILFFAPHDVHFNVFPPNFKCHIVAFSPTLLQKYFTSEEIELLTKATLALRTEKLLFDDHALFAYRVKSLIRRLLNDSSSFDEASLCDYFFTELRAACNTLLSQKMAYPSVKQMNIVIRRAMDYLYSSKELNVTVLELAEKSFTTVRNLQIAFMKSLNMTPKRFLMLRRLHYIRYHLRNAGTLSLNEHAAALKIKNIARLNQHYAKHFDESMRQTLELYRES